MGVCVRFIEGSWVLEWKVSPLEWVLLLLTPVPVSSPTGSIPLSPYRKTVKLGLKLSLPFLFLSPFTSPSFFPLSPVEFPFPYPLLSGFVPYLLLNNRLRFLSIPLIPSLNGTLREDTDERVTESEVWGTRSSARVGVGVWGPNPQSDKKHLDVGPNRRNLPRQE